MPIVNAAGPAAASIARSCPWLRSRIVLPALLLWPMITRADGCDMPLVVAWPSDRPPLSFSAQGQPGGLVADYLRRLGEQIALRPHPLPAAAGAAGALPAGTQAVLGWPREQVPDGWVVSRPYLQLSQVIVRRRNDTPLQGLGGLRGRRVASLDTVPLAAHLREQAPGAWLLQVDALDHALQLLAIGQVDAVVATLGEVEAALRRPGSDALVIAAPAGFDDAWVLAAAPACAATVAAFDTVLHELDDAQRAALRAAWAPSGARAPPARSPLRWLVPVLLVALALILVYAFGYWRLHRESSQRRALEQRLQEVTANLPAVVYRARRSGEGDYSLPLVAGDVQSLFGMSLDSVRLDHRRLMAAVHVDDRKPVLDHLEAAARARAPIDITFRTLGPHGWRWIRSHGRPLPGESDDIEWSGYWMDVSQAQARTRALAGARHQAEETAAAKTHFLATMSHQIRTPMSTLLGMLECLADSPLDPCQRQVLSTVDVAAQMLRQILDDVLDSHRLQALPLQLRATDMGALATAVQQLLAPMAASRALHLRCVLDPALQRWLLADGLRVRQVLFNLVGNALKFTLHGGVELRLRVLRTQAAGQCLRLQVSDSGVGISPERQQAVFADYTQAEPSTGRRFGGSGLGLAICRDLVASMGGELQLQSSPGKGTRIWFDLEFASCLAPLEAVPATAEVVARLPAARVLVAEDHPTNLQLLVQRLRELGLQVHATADGLQALAAWRAQGFDVVVTDCHMPGMDGFALARAIREDPCPSRARVPIIALTASVLESTREACRAAGIDRFLAKPVDTQGLRATLADVLPAMEPGSVGQ
ncbi:TPA: response regulator [Stenotrophomonas maltophilia]|nr:response regulator [Stenotrophomonas maltophilia]HEL7728423.1 response regulator [Stenotrophomonas maltophilia]